jgi:hypothetical protein
MEGKNVCKIYFVAAFALDMLAGGDPGFVALPDSLAPTASVQAVRHNRQRIFPVHQSLILASCQSPRGLNQGCLNIKKSTPITNLPVYAGSTFFGR